MADETFQSFWHGPLSSLEQLCLISFVRRGKDFDLYTYDDSLSVPDGVTLKDASEIYPKEEIFTYQRGPRKGSVAVFANFFRYKLLYEKGGWWVDTDVFYTGNELPEGEKYLGLQSEPEADHAANNAIMRLPKESSIARECMKRARSMGKKKAASSFGKSGPKLLTKVLIEKNRMDEARPKPYAYPIPVGEPEASYLPERKKWVEEREKRKPFLHFWNSILGKMGVQKDVRPPEGSYLNEQARELGLSWPCPTVQYSAQNIRRLSENYHEAQTEKWRARRLEQIQSSTTWKIVSRIASIRQKFGI
jgi:hypothetical protein